jgi:hypothetical protein
MDLYGGPVGIFAHFGGMWPSSDVGQSIILSPDTVTVVTIRRTTDSVALLQHMEPPFWQLSRISNIVAFLMTINRPKRSCAKFLNNGSNSNKILRCINRIGPERIDHLHLLSAIMNIQIHKGNHITNKHC